MKQLVLFVFLSSLIFHSQAKQYNILDYGAIADTAVLSTRAIQTAIDECNKTGGVVFFPAGNYKSGTLYFKDNVTLRLENGAVLCGSPYLEDYPENLPDYTFFRKGIIKRALIYAEKCSNIAIEGEGTIDGQGAKFQVPENSQVNSYSVRPYLIWMIQCKNVRVEGVHLRNSGLWMQHYLACDNLYIHNIEVFNHSNKNNDMMDIDGCHNVRISDCTGDSDDDGITLKSTSGRANENVVITNCVISSHCNAFKMGTESSTGFKNISVSNMVIKPSVVSDKVIYGKPAGISGISLETVDGGILDGVTISNVKIEGADVPLFLRLGSRNRAYKEDQQIEIGALRNVSISNVVATGASKTGCSISGIPGHPVENIHLSDISISFAGGGTEVEFNREIPEKEKSYPEATMFGNLPSYGFFIRHAKNVSFSNVQLITNSVDARPALYLNSVGNSEFKGMKLGNKGSTCHVLAENCSDIVLSENKIEGNSRVFAELKGSNNQNLFIVNNVLLGVEKTYNPESSKNAVIQLGNIKQYEEK